MYMSPDELAEFELHRQIRKRDEEQIQGFRDALRPEKAVDVLDVGSLEKRRPTLKPPPSPRVVAAMADIEKSYQRLEKVIGAQLDKTIAKVRSSAGSPSMPLAKSAASEVRASETIKAAEDAIDALVRLHPNLAYYARQLKGAIAAAGGRK